MLNIPFRTDEYGKNFYIEDDNCLKVIPYKTGEYSVDGINFNVAEEITEDVLKLNISINSDSDIKVKRLGMRLGIDAYMDTFPQWNDKYFPTALRCEEKGFWSCFMSPVGKIVSACSRT